MPLVVADALVRAAPRVQISLAGVPLRAAHAGGADEAGGLKAAAGGADAEGDAGGGRRGAGNAGSTGTATRRTVPAATSTPRS